MEGAGSGRRGSKRKGDDSEEMRQQAKMDPNQRCDVCGEQASGHYFGALVCLPCKVSICYLFDLVALVCKGLLSMQAYFSVSNSDSLHRKLKHSIIYVHKLRITDEDPNVRIFDLTWFEKARKFCSFNLSYLALVTYEAFFFNLSLSCFPL